MCDIDLWMVCWFSSHGESRARYSLTEPIPLQIEHAAIEFIMEPFHPSCPSLRTMKTSSAQWCRVVTSCFTHNWETCGGWEGLIPSHTGPKDLPTSQVPGLHHIWWGCQAWGKIAQMTAALTKLKPVWIDRSISLFQDMTNELLCHIHLPVCFWIMDCHCRTAKKNANHGNEVLPQDTTHFIQRLYTLYTLYTTHFIQRSTRKSVPRSSRQLDHTKTFWPL